MKHIFLYGPPGSGKSTLARSLAAALDLAYEDLDSLIQEHAGKSIPQIFAEEGEENFRLQEMRALQEVSERPPAVVALGGGALLSADARHLAESSGQVLCLRAKLESLLNRLGVGREDRPLLAGDTETRLRDLLDQRAAHYDSFALQLETDLIAPEDLVWASQLRLGAFRVRGMGSAYDVRIQPGGLDHLGETLRARGLQGPLAVVSDDKVGAIYLDRVLGSLHAAGFQASAHCMKPGEANKTIQTVLEMWDFFIQAGVERGSTVIALGGGVVGDLAGFAAATFLRGVAWVNVPTSLLAMVDSSMGGKTGFDLPQAKNLVGAFHPPRLVLADPLVLRSLPARELRNGLAEVVKHGIISDPDLFALCEAGLDAVMGSMERIVLQGMAVKLQVIDVDPYEKGLRQALNLGHTIGHGVELASAFQLGHGEAVAIGMVAEARLAEELELAERGLAERIAAVLAGLGLPTTIPADLSAERIVQAMQLDKKRAAGKVRFALPVRIGEVRTGVVVDGWQEKIQHDLTSARGQS